MGTFSDASTVERHLRVSAAQAASWERARGFGYHKTQEEGNLQRQVASLGETIQGLPVHLRVQIHPVFQELQAATHTSERPAVNLVDALHAMLGEWLELYESILHPKPMASIVSEAGDIAAYGFQNYLAFVAARDEDGAAYSESDVEQFGPQFTQAILGASKGEEGTLHELPERTPEAIEDLLADLPEIGRAIVRTHAVLVGAEFNEEEITDLVTYIDTLAKAMLSEGRFMTDAQVDSLVRLMTKPIIQASPKVDKEQGYQTPVSESVEMADVLRLFMALDQFSQRHFAYPSIVLLAGSFYADGGKNALNYPNPLPAGYDTARDFKTQVRSRFADRQIPPGFNAETDDVDTFLAQWEEEHGSPYTGIPVIPVFATIEEELR
ncbi:hypothetical protein LRY65_02185 [Candidatus Woesebacteria bacterium]|nr:hypothetical protein [Candidatus Woesebacteria bacterium]MCD8507311.1 hypothetical protein [Candidatus Woesebacteria bacterium]MCD8527001.1 hypothetical protein [Candidatus Woesebacteria bacterium]MCD8546759.1 hypothetical protein [Candidatus Woesebacteria bacterium]